MNGGSARSLVATNIVQEGHDGIEHARYIGRRPMQFVADTCEPHICRLVEQSQSQCYLLIAQEPAYRRIPLKQEEPDT
jgi:hypothetical protein